MKLTNLKEASNYDVREYLTNRLGLSTSQWTKLYDDDFPRHSPFYVFVAEEKRNAGLIWRITLPLVIPYFLLVVLYVLIKWTITGNRYFTDKSPILKFHKMWMKKLGINWM